MAEPLIGLDDIYGMALYLKRLLGRGDFEIAPFLKVIELLLDKTEKHGGSVKDTPLKGKIYRQIAGVLNSYMRGRLSNNLILNKETEDNIFSFLERIESKMSSFLPCFDIVSAQNRLRLLLLNRLCLLLLQKSRG